MRPETILARGQLPPLDRSTIHPYEDGVPGPVYYQRRAHPVSLHAEDLLGELEGGHSLLYPSGAGATAGLVLALLGPGCCTSSAAGGSRL